MRKRAMQGTSIQRLLTKKVVCNFLCRLRNKSSIEKIGVILIFLSFTVTPNILQAQRLTRDLNVALLTNQVGYRPSSTKTCLLKESSKRDFEVIEITSGQVAYRGTLLP